MTSLCKQEFLGDMPESKTYKVRQAYWWVFTHPGCLAGCVVELREARNHGAPVRVRRYSVMEQPSDDTRRVFRFEKPTREWKPDEEKTYTVYYLKGSRQTGAGANWCSCPAFDRRRKCSHLEALLSLTNRTATPLKVAKKPAGHQAHHWERKGPASFRCVGCGMRAFDPVRVDNTPEVFRCDGHLYAGPDRADGPPPAGRDTAPRKPTTRPPAAGRKPAKTAPSGTAKPPGKGKPHTPARKPARGR
jgi:hypothetical protein